MNGRRASIRALACAALGNVIFGFSFMFSRIGLSFTQPFVMLMYRFDATFVLMGLMILCLRRRASRPAGESGIDWLRFRLKGRNILSLLGLGLIQPVGYFLCESYGIRLTNATFSGVVIALVPIAAIAGSAVTLKEYPKPAQVAFSLLSIAGVILMTLEQREAGQVQPLGVVLLLGAIGYLSVLSSIVAFMALNYANNDLPVAKSTAFANLTTMISLFAGVIFLGEPVSILSLIASVMIIIGIWGSQRA